MNFVFAQVARMETVRAAQERLDAQVASGDLPDAATLGVIETARREAERAAARKAKVNFSNFSAQ